MTEFDFTKVQAFAKNSSNVVIESATNSVFSKASGLYCKWQWQSLYWSMFLEKSQVFTKNGNDRILSGFCDRICL